MLLDLNKLHGASERVQRTIPPSVFEPDDPDYRVAAPVELSMTVEQAGGDAFRVAGRAQTRLELECGRCLEPFEMPVDAAFDLRYVPQERNTGEGDPSARSGSSRAESRVEREIAEDDLTTAFYREGMLDVIDLLREQFQLALPMKPLCTEDCRGLCPECGANQNRTACDCTPKWEDPRLAPLKGLLNREQ
jgi:uncharacterized protein